MELNLFDQTFTLDGRRALWWHQKRWLIIADAHWGKTHYFQRHGLGVGHGVLRADLKRLADLIKIYSPHMLVCLGDLIHHEHSLTDSLMEEISSFRHEFPLPMTLIKGNHERYIEKLPENWGIEIIADQFNCDGLTLCHEEENIPGPQIYGHLHPKLKLKGQGDSLSLPCFLLKKNQMVLPAFSEFCAGKSVELLKAHQAFVCFNESEVISFP